jgi:hypothetical protein
MSSAPAPEDRSSEARRDRRAVLLALSILFAPIFLHDLVSPPSRDWSVRWALGAIRQYQRWVSPNLGQICRFEPSCSRYTYASIEKHGLVVGCAKGAWRIARCNPLTERGTVDLP